MKKLYLLFSFCSICSLSAQQVDNLFCISYRHLPNPSGPSTNGIIHVGEIAPQLGFVSNVGPSVSVTGGAFTVSGGAANQINNTFALVGRNSYTIFELNTGNLLQQNAINPFDTLGVTYFDNVRFNNSNATLYGLARVRVNNQLEGIYFSKLDTDTGNLIQLSTSSIGEQIVLNGAVIDPDQMIYYYSDGPRFVGIDLYNGAIFSNPEYVFSTTETVGFANIAFNCSDNEIYGLVRGRTPGANPLFPLNYILTLKLGKINPTTGVVTEINAVNLPSQAYSLTASSSIDELNRIYYFEGLNKILYGISLDTGLVVSSVPLTFQDGQVVHFMNNYNNCIDRVALRPNPDVLNSETFTKKESVLLYPNPASSIITIETDFTVDKVEVIDNNGRIVKSILNEKTIPVEGLESGIYFVKVYSESISKTLKFVKI